MKPEWGSVMECRCRNQPKPREPPAQCSITTACGKHWKQQEFAQSQGACQGGGRERDGGGRLSWEASAQEACTAYKVLLNDPRTARAVPLSHGHPYHQGGALLEAVVSSA